MLLDPNRGLKELEKLWSEISKIPVEKIDRENFIENKEVIFYIRDILKGRNKSYKYALLTQVLAKWLDPSVNALALQKQAGIEGSFDARSFCRKVVIAFEKKQLNNILGGANDPYVSKPLRNKMITLDETVFSHIKDKDGWRKLYSILKLVQSQDKIFTEKVLKQILLEIRRLQLEFERYEEAVGSIKPPITAYDLRQIISKFIETPSEGARTQAVVYALMRVLNKRVKAFERIESSRSTVADIYAGKLADIECFGEDGLVKVGIAVTEVLDHRKLWEELDKAVHKGLGKLIIVAYKIKPGLNIEEIVNNYKDKIDVVVNELEDFIVTMTILLNSNMRRDFIEEVREVLRELNYLDHLKAWDEILSTQLRNKLPGG